MLAIARFFLLVGIISLLSLGSEAQSGQSTNQNLVYVDKKGVLRFSRTKAEAAFFGVNYTVPFAYGYRSVKRTGIDVKKAIDQDVYHLARLGLDAFRVHVWDWEISDSMGNLLENEHLRLFDYLLLKLEERNIRIIITPIAFWGNGYPEQDIHTGSFSNVYGKGPAVVKEEAIRAQESYLKQFFKHINPYTKLSYTSDPNVIATELNNEPHHSGPKERTTEYINRLAAAVRSTGWSKPVFYNISESPAYADAVAKSNVQGYSFQWYPTGLVANHTLQGNFLPNVDRYHIPFIDTIPAFKNKARMVYEFDAGDVLQSNMYPAMARSFRGAGFQWATQFAYDPMATAYANTEYQTHYLNLAYVPSKAISLLIASKAFHKLPRYKSYGIYPIDSAFDDFRVSYSQQLSEMNSPAEFYYSNTTTTAPLNPLSLQHIAGVGSSPIVEYSGNGAYFIDKVADGVWRLEVMPDAIHIRDPFEKASPKKEVTRIQWQTQQMKVMLPGLESDFTITAVNADNNYNGTSVANGFTITPGTYLLKNKALSFSIDPATRIGTIRIDEFVAPKPLDNNVWVTHQPLEEVSSGAPFTINAKIVGVDTNARVSAELRNSAGKWKTVQLKPITAFDYAAQVPADMVTPGVINYRIIVQKTDTSFAVFPGNHKENPYAWDAYENDSWQTYVAASNSPIPLFNAGFDRSNLAIYNPSWQGNTIGYITGEQPMQLIQKLEMTVPVQGEFFGWQLFVADKLKGRQTELALFKQLVVRARSGSSTPAKIKVTLLATDGLSYSAEVSIPSIFSDISVPLASLKLDSTLLLPRPYPGFQPLLIKEATSSVFDLRKIEKLQLLFVPGKQSVKTSESLEVETVLIK